MPCLRNFLPCSSHPFGGNVFISNWRQGNHTEHRSGSGDDLATSTLCVPLNWHIVAMTHQVAMSLCGLFSCTAVCLCGQLISLPEVWLLGFMLSTHLVSGEIGQVFPRVTSVYFPPTRCEVFRSSRSCQYLSPTSLTLFIQVYGVSSWLRLAFPWWPVVLSSFHVSAAAITWKRVPSCLFSIFYRTFPPFLLLHFDNALLCSS